LRFIIKKKNKKIKIKKLKMAEEIKEEKKEEKKEEEKKEETKKETEEEKEETKEEKEEEKFSKEKLYGILMAVAGVVIFVVLALFYPGFWDLFIKGIVFLIAIGAIGLVILGIIFGIYA